MLSHPQHPQNSLTLDCRATHQRLLDVLFNDVDSNDLLKNWWVLTSNFTSGKSRARPTQESKKAARRSKRQLKHVETIGVSHNVVTQ